MLTCLFVGKKTNAPMRGRSFFPLSFLTCVDRKLLDLHLHLAMYLPDAFFWSVSVGYVRFPMKVARIKYFSDLFPASFSVSTSRRPQPQRAYSTHDRESPFSINRANKKTPVAGGLFLFHFVPASSRKHQTFSVSSPATQLHGVSSPV